MAIVLIVDDEPDIVLFAQINLEMNGHVVRTAANGAEALAAIRDDPPDAVVLDVMMPLLDGWKVLEQLKSDPDEAIRTVPVVMLTAMATDEDQVRGGIEGAVRYLTKPVTPEALVDAVEDVLAQGPEPAQRKAAQTKALERLARMERGATDPAPTGNRPHLSRLERPRQTQAATPTPPPARVDVTLTDKQRELLQALQASSSVSAAADDLGMSRSNVYASLRRIGRKLDVTDVSELLRRLRSGELSSALDG